MDKQVENIIPYLVPAEEVVPGVPTVYRTVYQGLGQAIGVDVLTREGRVMVVEPNDAHPDGSGGLPPRRSVSSGAVQRGSRGRPVAGGSRHQLEAGLGALADALRLAAPGTVHVVTGPATGATNDAVSSFLAAVGSPGNHTRYDALSYADVRAANHRVFGVAGVPSYNLNEADLILSFGAEFLGLWGNGTGQDGAFAANRTGDHPARFISATPRHSFTDANADDWVPVAPGKGFTSPSPSSTSWASPAFRV